MNQALQWVGAVFIIAAHCLNALGPVAHPWNIGMFFVGTSLFLIWSMRVGNRPQLLINVVALAIGALGLAAALG